MGVETELLGLKNRYDGKEFRVIEREDGTIAVLAGDKVLVDSGVVPVTATLSDGRVVFSEPALNRAVRTAIPHILSEADIEARPPRLWPVDAVPYRLFCAVGDYALGHGTDLRTLVRVNVQTRQASTGFQFPAGWTSRMCMPVTAAHSSWPWKSQRTRTVCGAQKTA